MTTVIQSIFSDGNDILLEIKKYKNYREIHVFENF